MKRLSLLTAVLALCASSSTALSGADSGSAAVEATAQVSFESLAKGLAENLRMIASNTELSKDRRESAFVLCLQQALTSAAKDAKREAQVLEAAARLTVIAATSLPEQGDLFIDAALGHPSVAALKNAEKFIVAAVDAALGQEPETAQAEHHRRSAHEFHGNRRDCVISRSTVKNSQ